MANSEYIDTNERFASMRQIHAAIDHLHKGDFECAITLAAAGEGILPPTDRPYLLQKIKAMVESLPSHEGEANRANNIINWLKHGTTLEGSKRIENTTISEVQMIAVIARAISKFIAVYNYQTSQMASFVDWAIARLSGERK
jgi:hypothetical protein